MSQANFSVGVKAIDDGATATMQRVERAAESMATKTKRAGTAATQAAQQTTSAAKGAGTGVLQLAYIVDDLQYGMRGIVNNIPALVNGMGMGAGIAGAAGIAAVVIGKLTEEFLKADQSFKAFMDGAPEKYNAVAEAAEKKAEKVTAGLKMESEATNRLLELEKERMGIRAEAAALGADRKKTSGAQKILTEAQTKAKIELDSTVQEAERKRKAAVDEAARAEAEAIRLEKEKNTQEKLELEARKRKGEAQKAYNDRSILGPLALTAWAAITGPDKAVESWAKYKDAGDALETETTMESAQSKMAKSARERAASAADFAATKRAEAENAVKEASLQKTTAMDRYNFEMQKAATENTTLLKAIKENMEKTLFESIVEE